MTEYQKKIVQTWDRLVLDTMSDEEAISFIANYMGIEPLEVLEAMEAVNIATAN